MGGGALSRSGGGVKSMCAWPLDKLVLRAGPQSVIVWKFTWGRPWEQVRLHQTEKNPAYKSGTRSLWSVLCQNMLSCNKMILNSDFFLICMFWSSRNILRFLSRHVFELALIKLKCLRVRELHFFLNVIQAKNAKFLDYWVIWCLSHQTFMLHSESD